MTTHKKNEEYELKITDIGSEGEGIGHLEDGYTLFVQGALPGDTIRAHIIKAQKKYGIAKPVEILEPSSDRVVPACPIADKCGGCQIAALSYDAQLRYKENKVRELLVRVGGFEAGYVDEVFEGIIGYADDAPRRSDDRTGMPDPARGEKKAQNPEATDMEGQTSAPSRFRNKAQYPVGAGTDGHVITGFYAPRSHRIVPCADCLIGAESDAVVLRVIREYMSEFGISAYDETTGKGLVRHILIRTGYTTGEIQVCIVINGKKLPRAEALIERFRSAGLNIVSICTSTNTDATNVILGDNFSVIYGQEYVTDKIGDLSFRISPLSFYQVNPVQTRKLYGKALEYAGLTGGETVWDLYCGIGTISLFLARSAGKVYGVEVVPEAIEDARENARLNGIDNAEFMVGRAEEVLPNFYADNVRVKSDESSSHLGVIDDVSDFGSALHPDVIVVDPPRKGCDEACLQTMLKMQPGRIVYVSCDPATLARDLKYLCASGDYELKKVSCTDMFSNSVHVETVCLLERK
ncbi:MAG: 23S rRNA (uracil(1939)-C(5))-methyltransferase RlmD [Lachnospiraceae bacterium]|nr:23S rRNA (uracil(1939)-C(5))-methyltransferase RlmD [Lachnospiraceae bacterium]